MSAKLSLVPPRRKDSAFFMFVAGVSLETHRVYSKMPAKWIVFAAHAAEAFANNPNGTFGDETGWRSGLESDRGPALVACIAYGLMHRSTMEGVMLLTDAALVASGKPPHPRAAELEDICLAPFIAPIPKQAQQAWLERQIVGNWGHGKPPNAKRSPRPIRGCPCVVCHDLKVARRPPMREDLARGQEAAPAANDCEAPNG